MKAVNIIAYPVGENWQVFHNAIAERPSSDGHSWEVSSGRPIGVDMDVWTIDAINDAFAEIGAPYKIVERDKLEVKKSLAELELRKNFDEYIDGTPEPAKGKLQRWMRGEESN